MKIGLFVFGFEDVGVDVVAVAAVVVTPVVDIGEVVLGKVGSVEEE